MNPQWVISSLRTLQRSFRQILEDDAGDVIQEAIAGIELSKQLHDTRKRQKHDRHLGIEPWGYTIHPDRPLKFKSSAAIKGLDPRIDVFSTVLWMEDDQPPVRQNTHLRVWCNSDHAYRERWDAPEIMEKLTDPTRTAIGRVMYRCHFDLAENGQAGPKYHLQFGGNARDDELCWFPEVIDIPRLVCPPMDLILACQMVAANFFWDRYNEFRDTPEWMTALLYSQEHLLKQYYKECFDTVVNSSSLLDHLWNH